MHISSFLFGHSVHRHATDFCARMQFAIKHYVDDAMAVIDLRACFGGRGEKAFGSKETQERFFFIEKIIGYERRTCWDICSLK